MDAPALGAAWRRWLLALTDRLPCKVIKGPDGTPFLERYHLLAVPWFGARLGAQVVVHRFVASDPDRGFHDHPYRWAVALLLAGGYDELIVPRADAPPRERFRRRLGAVALNRLDPRRFHRVLLRPGSDAWTLFVTGPRVKGWGFLARPGAHRYAPGASTDADHYDRPGVERALRSGGDAFFDEAADVSFRAPDLEYRAFADRADARDAGWWRHAPTGRALRRAGEACPTAERALCSRRQVLVLLSGKRGAGKDFVAAALARALGARAAVFRIGEATKAAYAARTGVPLDGLIADRALKERHRAGLTALYDELRRADEGFELDRLAAALLERGRGPTLLCVADLRMRYELEYLRARTPPGALVHVRVEAGARARARRGVAEPDDAASPGAAGPGAASPGAAGPGAAGLDHATEVDLDGVAPDLVLRNDGDGDAVVADSLLRALRGLLASRGVDAAHVLGP